MGPSLPALSPFMSCDRPDRGLNPPVGETGTLLINTSDRKLWSAGICHKNIRLSPTSGADSSPYYSVSNQFSPPLLIILIILQRTLYYFRLGCPSFLVRDHGIHLSLCFLLLVEKDLHKQVVMRCVLVSFPCVCSVWLTAQYLGMRWYLDILYRQTDISEITFFLAIQREWNALNPPAMWCKENVRNLTLSME